MTDLTVDPGADTRLVEVKGRTVMVRRLKDAQLALMVREGQILQRDATHLTGEEAARNRKRKVAALGNIISIFESAVVQEDDCDYITMLNVNGELEMADFFGFISAFREEETATAPPTVRRGRPVRARS